MYLNTLQSHVKLFDMAFVAPVLKHNYDLYSKDAHDKNPRKKRDHEESKEQKTIESNSENELLAARSKRMELLRERRMRRYPKKKTKVVLRKISEINEEAEQELYFDEIMQGFTKMRGIPEAGDDSDSSRDDHEVANTRTSEQKHAINPEVKREKKKKHLFGPFYWTPFSFKTKKSSTAQKVIS